MGFSVVTKKCLKTLQLFISLAQPGFVECRWQEAPKIIWPLRDALRWINNTRLQKNGHLPRLKWRTTTTPTTTVYTARVPILSKETHNKIGLQWTHSKNSKIESWTNTIFTFKKRGIIQKQKKMNNEESKLSPYLYGWK